MRYKTSQSPSTSRIMTRSKYRQQNAKRIKAKEYGMKALGHVHPEHDYIVARQERYIAAWKSGSPDKIMAFMDSKELHYSVPAMGHEGLSHSATKELFAKNVSGFHDLDIKTRSLHGHKHFTTWEWTLTCKGGVGSNGERLSIEDASPKEMIGCNLMWWNNDDKIIRNHEYGQLIE